MQQLATKAELKAEQDKIAKLEAFNSGYFYGNFFFSDDRFQNVHVYQSALATLELRKDKGTDYVLSWKSKGYILLNLSHYTLLL